MSKFMKCSLVAFWLIAGGSYACYAQTSEPAQQREPGNCETNSLILDNMRYEATKGSGKDSFIIIIARLGNGESSRELNRRRLYNLGMYWKEYNLPAEKLILAEGERINGYGRVELYVGGKLFDVLLVNRDKDLCVACCGDDEKYYPLRDKKRQR